MISSKRLVPPLAALVLALPAQAAEFRLGQPVMGTVLQITVIASDAESAKRLAEDCLREARRWDDILTTWRAEGELAQFNRRAGEGSTQVSDDLAYALGRMLALSQATRGAFDPAVAPWVDRWRTPRASSTSDATVPRLPTVLRLDGTRATLRAGAALDAGGIGKGIALDAMVRRLREGGVLAAFIDFGGSSLYGVGAPPESPEGWIVAVSGLAEGELHGTMALRDTSLSTSRSSGSGDVAGPIIDPRTGRPTAGPRLAVVLSPDATAADAWSTALVVLGSSGLEQAAKVQVETLLQEPTSRRMTPGFEKNLRKGT